MSLTVTGNVCKVVSLIFSDKIFVAFVLPDHLFNIQWMKEIIHTLCAIF